ncbi:MAG: hypothetical protein DIU65_11810 [Proteobacteria bacterium]|nr:MAG: hypothetical protein DIU65_11810 [Pseudomonadota bacterium]
MLVPGLCQMLFREWGFGIVPCARLHCGLLLSSVFLGPVLGVYATLNGALFFGFRDGFRFNLHDGLLGLEKAQRSATPKVDRFSAAA